jgi:hypothetical protein
MNFFFASQHLNSEGVVWVMYLIAYKQRWPRGLWSPQ